MKIVKVISALFVLLFFAGIVFFIHNLEVHAQEKTYSIGDRGPAGGWIFYDKGEYSDGWRYLEVASEPYGGAQWGCQGHTIPGATGTSIGAGKSNTQAILESCGDYYCSVRVATSYPGTGKNDWFLPSKDELYLIYKNLYNRGIGDFQYHSYYWSSSERNKNNAWFCIFVPEHQATSVIMYASKKKFFLVRPIRSF